MGRKRYDITGKRDNSYLTKGKRLVIKLELEFTLVSNLRHTEFLVTL